MKTLAAVSFSLCVVSLPAQILVVDPLGGGTHTDLQTAINAAPSGAVIRVRGGAWGPLTITRSLTIVGENTPRVSAPFTGSGFQPAAITLQGSGTQTAVLGGLNVSGPADEWWNGAGPGIRSSGFARLAVHDCTVRGHDWTGVNGTAPGASGIVVSGPATIHVARCTIAASRSFPFPNSTNIPSGAPAIGAPTATVVVLDSSVTGGPVDPSVFQIGAPWPSPCPCGTPGQEPGRGGDGIVASVVHVSGSTITGGTGSPVLSGMPPAPFGNQPSGVPIVANAQAALATTLSQTAPLRLGRTYAIGFAPTSVPSLLVLGSPSPFLATALGIQSVFIDLAQPLALHFLPVPSMAFSLPVPANVRLLGIELSTQRFDLGPGGLLLATNPLLAVVLP